MPRFSELEIRGEIVRGRNVRVRCFRQLFGVFYFISIESSCLSFAGTLTIFNVLFLCVVLMFFCIVANFLYSCVFLEYEYMSSFSLFFIRLSFCPPSLVFLFCKIVVMSYLVYYCVYLFINLNIRIF